MILHYCNCGKKYAHPRSAERCCSEEAKKIAKQSVAKEPVTRKKNLTSEDKKLYRREYYLKNKKAELESQRIRNSKV
jgi:hypothetical protein